MRYLQRRGGQNARHVPKLLATISSLAIRMVARLTDHPTSRVAPKETVASEILLIHPSMCLKPDGKEFLFLRMDDQTDRLVSRGNGLLLFAK